MSLGSIVAKNIALDACYGGNHSAEWPADTWLHLFGGDPTQGALELLIGTGAYEPIEMANNNTTWLGASGGQKTTAIGLAFPTSTGAWSAAATFFWLTDAAAGLLPPVTPSVTVHGAGGTTNWQYVITALNATGETTGSGIGVTTVGSSVLTGSNYNALAWTAVAGATGYNVYRLVGTVFELIASGVAGTSYNDTGASPSAVSPPISNTTMNLLDGGPLANPINVIGSGYLVSFPAGSIVIATN